tara:strand:- start:303 stop:815 length:513 start_codon:yes stop_codon:yes gene_type:complete
MYFRQGQRRCLEATVTDAESYKKILLAVDLTEESNDVANRAIFLAEQNRAELHVVHVIEPLGFSYGGDVPMDVSSVQEQIQNQAQQHLNEFASRLSVAEGRHHLIFGRPESEIQKLAVEISADLILVGSHGRHGIALLFGSTANGVLHKANCDVLAVRVGSTTHNRTQDN